MRGGNHGKVVIECSVDPLIVRAMLMLRAAKEMKDFDVQVRNPRVRRFVAEMIETYIPPLFMKTFGLSIHEFNRRWPSPAAKELPGIAQQLLNDPNFYRPARAAMAVNA
jgi:hypothetical protein